MLKFIAKTAVAFAKCVAVGAVINHIMFLDYKVAQLEAEIGKLKTETEG